LEFFAPHLILRSEPGGQFTLLASTLVPSPCWQAAPARLGSLPANVGLTGETVLIDLPLASVNMACVPRPIFSRHRMSDLRLADKKTIWAFVKYGDSTLGSATLAVGSAHAIKRASVSVESSDWCCWLQPARGEHGILHVAGLVWTPTAGYLVRLQPTSSQGTNPEELLLDLVVEARPGDFWPQIVRPHSVHFEQPGECSGVRIQEPDGNSVHLVVSGSQ
jgi:hypothetical protein